MQPEVRGVGGSGREGESKAGEPDLTGGAGPGVNRLSSQTSKRSSLSAILGGNCGMQNKLPARKEPSEVCEALGL